MTPKMMTASTVALIVALGSGPAWASSESSEAQSMEDKIEAADAPDIAETDPVNETAEDRKSPDMQANAAKAAQDAGHGGMVLSLQTMAEDIYERGYRQGYIRGMQEAREDIAMQIGYLAKRQQLTRNYQEWASHQDMTDGQNPEQQTEAKSQGDDASQQFDLNRISGQVGARPGGSIVILPPGVSPERFIERLVNGDAGSN